MTSNVAQVPYRTFNDPKFGERQEAFRKRLSDSGLTCRTFCDGHELEKLIFQALVETDESRVTVPATSIWPKGESPYPGLTQFTRKYAEVFFGREEEVNEVLERIRTPGVRFVIISGGSGTGKSSLVDAGVLPKLEENGLPEIERFVCKRMVPSQGEQPFDALMRALHLEVAQAGLDPYERGHNLPSEPGILSDNLKTIISKGAAC